MRLLSNEKPYIAPEDGYTLEALELLPCGVLKEDESFVLVRYESLNPEVIEGDLFCLTVEEAIEAAELYYRVKRTSWYLEGDEYSKNSLETNIRIVLKYHFDNIKNR